MNFSGNNFFNQGKKTLILPRTHTEALRSTSTQGFQFNKTISITKIFKANKVVLKTNEFFPKYINSISKSNHNKVDYYVYFISNIGKITR